MVKHRCTQGSQGETFFFVFRYVRGVFQNIKFKRIFLTSSNANSCHLRFPSSCIYPGFERLWFLQELCEVDNFRFKKTSAFLCKKDYVMDIIQVRSWSSYFKEGTLFHLFYLYFVSTVRTRGQIFLEQTDVC